MAEDTHNPLLDTREAINPYRTAAALLLRRFQWDLNPESWRSRRKLARWKNRFPGQKAVILCNGPSLLKCDFSQLESVFTFGLNKINLLFDKSAFRPSCIVAVNPFVLEQNADFYNESDIPLFLSWKAAHSVKARDSVAYLHTQGVEGFARNCQLSIFEGYTVTYVAMQLAFHMGFTDVALVGCDHNFAVKGPANATVQSGEQDESHFDPRYFAGGQPWQLPDLFESEVAYTRAFNQYQAHGRRLVNCTVGGELEALPRMELDAFLGNP